MPATFASDPDRLARFHREAQLFASLNHPHIAAIYGFEASGDIYNPSDLLHVLVVIPRRRRTRTIDQGESQSVEAAASDESAVEAQRASYEG